LSVLTCHASEGVAVQSQQESVAAFLLAYNETMQITYFPQLHMDRVPEIRLVPLGVTVWNYGVQSPEYVTDPKLRDVIDKFMQANIRHKRPITDMGIITIGQCDMRPFDSTEMQVCQEVRLILFLAGVAHNNVIDRSPNAGIYTVTAENFDLVVQNFEPDGQYTAVEDGYVVRKLIGGYRVGEVQFPTPLYTPTPALFWRDNRLIDNLMRLRQTQKRLYRRILRASELLMQSYYNDTKLSSNARILTMAAAYETLFDLPEQGQRKELKEVFERLFVLPDDPKVTFVSHWEGKKPKRVSKSMKVYWANAFYELRNQIIHGSVIKPEAFAFRGKQRHFDIATLFFVLGVKKLIAGAPGSRPTYDFIRWGQNGGLDDEDMAYEGFLYEKGDLTEAIHDMARSRRAKRRHGLPISVPSQTKPE
jgi:hypothetical protein